VTADETRARAHSAAVDKITQDQRFGILSTAAVRTLVSVALNAALPIVGEGYTDEVKAIVAEAKAEMESKFVDMVAPAIETGITQALAEERAAVGPQIEALKARIRELEATALAASGVVVMKGSAAQVHGRPYDLPPELVATRRQPDNAPGQQDLSGIDS
jgi:hypothetical protein